MVLSFIWRTLVVSLYECISSMILVCLGDQNLYNHNYSQTVWWRCEFSITITICGLFGRFIHHHNHINWLNIWKILGFLNFIDSSLEHAEDTSIIIITYLLAWIASTFVAIVVRLFDCANLFVGVMALIVFILFDFACYDQSTVDL